MDEIRDLRDLFAGHAIQSTYPDKATAEKAFGKMMAAHDVWVNTRTGETFKVEGRPNGGWTFGSFEDDSAA